MSKTLYIPTTSLNFNNIFASESISPVVFYPQRKFGYKSFEKIELNHFDNSLLLYDKLPIFEIHDTERDNYPIVIEIDCFIEDLQPIKTLNEVSIYQLSDTLYLNPFSTKVYFFSNEARKITLLGAERSSSTKMVSLYDGNGCFHLVSDTIPLFSFSKEIFTGIKDVDYKEVIEKNIDKDGQINRAKGFLYSFLIGANKSLNKELLTIKRATREIGNIISAVIHSPDKTMSEIQRKNLSTFCKEFSNAYSLVDNSEKGIIDKIKAFSEEKGLGNNSIQVLETFNVLDQVKRDFIQHYGLKEPFDIENFLDCEWNENIFGRLNQSVLNLEKKYLEQQSKIVLSEKINLANSKITNFSMERADFYVSLINDFLTYCNTDESQVNITVKAGKMLRKMYEENKENWESSKSKKYINSLLANMQGKGDFLVINHNNILLESFSIFILNKNDYEKIEKSLIDNLISDFSYSFGLWGAFCGFANMPKTLTNELFLSDDLDYVSEVYKYIFKQIHGVELEGKIERKQVEFCTPHPTPKPIPQPNTPISTEPQINPEEQKFRANLKAQNIIKQEDQIIEMWQKNHSRVDNNLFNPTW